MDLDNTIELEIDYSDYLLTDDYLENTIELDTDLIDYEIGEDENE